jgi:hypothetical protein
VGFEPSSGENLIPREVQSRWYSISGDKLRILLDRWKEDDRTASFEVWFANRLPNMPSNGYVRVDRRRRRVCIVADEDVFAFMERFFPCMRPQ